MTPTDTLARHPSRDAHLEPAGEGPDFPALHPASEAQRADEGGEPDPATTNVAPTTLVPPSLPSNSLDDQRGYDAQRHVVVEGHTSATPAIDAPVSIRPAPGLADPTLALLAEVLDDLERTRIANENRLRALTRSEEDSDGEIRGFGLDATHPDVARLAGVVEGIAALEHQATLNLQRAMRRHPLGPWVKATKGVGEKQGARLLAAIGDPYWNYLHNRPRRGPAELWAYCGLHVLPARHLPSDDQVLPAGGDQTGGNPGPTRSDSQRALVGVAAKRQKGQRANWSNVAKMRAFVIAESCIKKRESPYRPVYDTGREKYAAAVHAVECRQCGPKGKPAAPGSPLSAGHQHARAMRLVMKELLKDLWREAKRIHEEDA